MPAPKWSKGLGGASLVVGALVLVAVSAPGGPSVGGGSSGQPAARQPLSGGTWDSMGLKRAKSNVGTRATNCVASSYGKVRQFFGRKPCRSLQRALYTLSDSKGNTLVVSVAWVGMASSADAAELKALTDGNGTGNVLPLSGAGVKFTGTNYSSRQSGSMVVIAEAEPLKGRPSSLSRVAQTAAKLPPP